MYQYKKFNERLNKYILQEIHNPEDIIVLAWDLEDPTQLFWTN